LSLAHKEAAERGARSRCIVNDATTGEFSGIGVKNNSPLQSRKLNEGLTYLLPICGFDAELLRGAH
jgi:hypothetical protein